MNCENFREQLPECLAGRLAEGARERLIEHLEGCSGCRGELAHLGVVWRGLEALKLEAEPDPAMKERFQATLAAFEAGLEQGRLAAVARLANRCGTLRRGGRGNWRPAWASWLSVSSPAAVWRRVRRFRRRSRSCRVRSRACTSWWRCR